MTIASAGNPSGAKLVAALLVILFYGVAAYALFTGSILTPGHTRTRLYRSGRPLAYWYYVLFYASSATLALLGVFFDYLVVHFRGIILIWLGAWAVALAIVMPADRRMAGLPSFNAGLGKLPLWAHLLSGAALVLVMVGVIGFIAPFVAVAGGLNWLPNSCEWPVGSANRAIAMPNGYHVVPLDFMSRIQVYDQNWRFVRGWFFDGGGGSVALRPAGQNRFEVFTGKSRYSGARGPHYIFTLNGDRVSQGSSSLDKATWNSIVKQATPVAVPTPIWLWPFSSPFHAWATLLCGALLSAFIQIRRRRATAANAARPEIWTYVRQ